MKGHIQIVIVMAVFLISIPFIALLSDRPRAAPAEADAGETVKVLFGEEEAPREIAMRDYIVGAVAAQMPADFEEEALKAQAVLAHTYALRRRAEEKLSPTAALKGADLSDDSTLYNAYFTDEQIKALYKNSYDETTAKLYRAADYALTRCLTFEGDPIISAFHAVSCGKTESALAAWNENIPYLVSVDSSWDLESKACTSVMTVTRKELYSQLHSALPDLTLDESSLTVQVTERTEAGCAATVELCGVSFLSGRDFASAAGLPSACFEVTEKNGSFEFTCKGRGHLVGLSQYGAQAMASDGKSCEEILSHYFPGTKLTSSERAR